MSKKDGSDVLRKWQIATEWKETTRGVVKQATKFTELMSSLITEGDTLTEELLKVHKLIVGPDGDGLPDSDILECSVMVLRNNIKYFVIMQREMMAKIFESFDTPLANAVDMDLLDSHETKKMYVKAQTEYDENKAKIQENIRKKKMDPEVILSCEKELDRLSLATEELKTTLDNNLDNLNSKRSNIYSKCMLQLMDKHHEFFLNGWDVLADIRPRLAQLEDHLSRADDKAPVLIKEAIRQGYLMKKTGFGWTKCWVSIQAQQKKSSNPARMSNLVNDTAIVLTWQPTSAKPSKDGRRKVDVCLCTVRMRPSTGEFEVVTPSKKRPLVLHAENDSERSAWVDALLLAISLGLQGINNHIPQLKELQESSDGDNDTTQTPAVGSTMNPSVLMRVEGNNVCADCDSPDPDWASINLGILLCLECSGVHRNMGTHISKVRSLNLDVWDAETVQLSQRLGNRRVNGFYESSTVKVAANKPGQKTEREARMRYVQSKYKDLRFVDDERKGSASGMLGVMLCESTARNSDVLDVLMLLALGADPNMLGPGPESLTTATLVTPMISAICHNNLVLLELLLLNGGDVFVPDGNGLSALQHAVTLKMVQSTSLLLRRGFSAKTAAHLRAKALEIAESQNDEQLVKLLKIETGTAQQSGDERSPGSPFPNKLLRSPLSRSLSISTGPRDDDSDDLGFEAVNSSPPVSRRTSHQPQITISPSIPIRHHSRPPAKTISSMPTSPLSASAPTSPTLSPPFPSVLSSKSSTSSPTRPALTLSTSYESPATSPRQTAGTDSEVENDLRMQYSTDEPEPAVVPVKEHRSRRLSLKRHSKKPSVDEKGTSNLSRENSKERTLSRENSHDKDLTRERSNSATKDSRSATRERSNSNSKEKGRERSNSGAKDKDHRETLRENSKENLREYIKGKLGKKKDKHKDKDKEKEKDKDKEREKEKEREAEEKEKELEKEREREREKEREKEKETEIAPVHSAPIPIPSALPISIPSSLSASPSPSPTSPTSPPLSRTPPFLSATPPPPSSSSSSLSTPPPPSGLSPAPTTPTPANTSTSSSSSTYYTPLTSPLPPPSSSSSPPSQSSSSSPHAPSEPAADPAPPPANPALSSSSSYTAYAYSPIPSAPTSYGYSPLPSYAAVGPGNDDDDDYPDPTPIPPDPDELNQFDNPDTKMFFALSTQLMELVNTLKNLVKDETTKKISSSVSAALKEIETFANKERLPQTHVIHDKDHMQQKLNRLLGYVSTMGRVYQQQHHLIPLSSSTDEALARYCAVLGRVCRMLEEAL